MTPPSRTLIAAVALVIIPAAAALIVAPSVAEVELKRVLYAGAATLTFGGLLGGLLKILLDDLATAGRKRDDAAGFVQNVLSDLKSVYDRVGRAKILIPAHQSVKTYGELMRDLIDARVQLRNVARAVERRADGVAEDARRAVIGKVVLMEDYLELLTSEFREKYKDVSDLQRAYEAKVEAVLEQFAKSDTTDSPQIPNRAWMRLQSFPQLADFIGEGQAYRTQFEESLDDASEVLRTEYARILRRSAI